MKDILYASLITLGCILFTIQTVQDENKIKTLQSTINSKDIIIDSLCNRVDSLKLEIDTLSQRLEIFDFQYYKKEFINLINAVIQVESGNNDNAYHKGEDAVGCLQIRQTMVNDVNRILARRDIDLRYSYNDRWDRNKSIEMFNIYCNHYNLVESEEIARCWNGGPRGIYKEATIGYWNKVEKQIEVNS
jgi:hypothetical protein